MLHTSGFHMKREYLTYLCKLIVEVLKVWFFVLQFQKNANQQLSLDIVHTHITNTVEFWSLPFYECFLNT